MISALIAVDPIELQQMCEQIQSDQLRKQRMKDLTDLIVLPFGSIFTIRGRREKIGLLIGKKGRRIRSLEKEYQIQLKIVTNSSSMQLQQKLLRLQREKSMKDLFGANDLYLILTKMDISEENTLSMDQAKKY